MLDTNANLSVVLCFRLFFLTFIGILYVCDSTPVYRSKRSNYSGQKVLRLHLNDDQDVQLVNSLQSELGVDIWGESVHSKKRYVDIRVTQENRDAIFQILAENKINYEIIINDVQALVDLETFENLELAETANGRRKRSLMNWPFTTGGKTSWREDETQSGDSMDGLLFHWHNIVGRYVSHREIDEWLEYATYAEPRLDIKLIHIGNSVQKRPLNVLKIGTKNGGPKPAIFMDGGIHAREWISPATVVFIIFQLIDTFGEDTEVAQLLEHFDWYFLPVVNPDGYQYSKYVDRFWRKNRAIIPGSYCIGVDLNRNFGFHWSECNGEPTWRCSLKDPCTNTYAGDVPFSEPESRAIEKFFNDMQNTVQVYFTMHAFSQLWLTPWGHTKQPPTDNDDLMLLANAGINAIQKRYGTIYEAGAPSVLLYTSSGDSMSWAKGQAGVKYSYSLELRDKGHYGFVLPPHLIIPTATETWDGVKAAMLTLLRKNQTSTPGYHTGASGAEETI